MARKERKKVIAFAIEATYGVDAIAAGAPKYLLGRECSITPMAGESQSLDYDDGTLGNKAEIVTEEYVTIEFTVDFAASGTATSPAAWGDLMKACLGKVTTAADNVTYNIDESGTGSATFYFYKDGALHKMTGARGSVSLSAQAKQFGGLKFSFTGLTQPVTSVSLPTPNFSAWKTPLKIGSENSAFTLGGVALKMISLEYDQANQVVYQEYVGHQEVIITDYKPTSTLVVEAPPLSSWNPFTLSKAGDLHALVFTNGSVGGSQVEFNSNVQIGRPTYGEQDGTQTYSIPIIPLGNSPAFATR